MIEIGNEVRSAFHNLGKLHAESHEQPKCKIAACIIADFARDQLAARLKAEWYAWAEGEKDHPYNALYPNYWDREKWTFADWQREAERLLGEKP